MFEKKIAMKVPAGFTGASVGGNFYEAKDGVVKVPANHAHSLLELGFSVQGLTDETMGAEEAQTVINDALTKKQAEFDELQKSHIAAVDENTKLRTDLDNAQKEIVRLTTTSALTENNEETAKLRQELDDAKKENEHLKSGRSDYDALRKELEAANQEVTRLKANQGAKR